MSLAVLDVLGALPAPSEAAMFAGYFGEGPW